MRRLTPHNTKPARASRGRRAGLAPTAALVLVLLPGCAWLDHQMHRDQVGIHAISLHYFAEPTGDLAGKTQMITDAAGTRRACIARAPILSNRHFMTGELESTDNPERPALRLRLDRQGSMLWLQACQDAPGDQVAVLLDGFFWYAMTLPRPTDTLSIRLDGPLGRTEAQIIVDSIPGQYRRLNPNPGLL
jgi:hypothetical protein